MDLPRLRRLLGGAETLWLVERVRGRLEHGRPLVGTVILAEATPAQRRAVEALLGRSPGSGRSLTVSLGDVDAVIRRGGLHPDGLGAAVVALTGPVVVLADVRTELGAAWAAALAPLARLVSERPVLAPWYELRSTRALIRRACGSAVGATPIVTSAAALLASLPLAGVPLSQVALDFGGDAHALDHGRPLATIVRSAIRHTWFPASPGNLSPAQQRRAEWDSVGVVADELSTTALTLNLPVGGSGPLAEFLTLAGVCGEPVVLTLRQLSRHTITFKAGPVFVCENPAVMLAAANALGSECPPLVCVSGQPTAASLRLLTTLAEAGCALRYHGDFDWGGIRIANVLWSRLPVQPWRFDTRSYLDRVARSSSPLRGTPVEAAWDTELADAVTRHGVRLEEEAVLEDLLADLADIRGHHHR
jgi:uncharacterized protein (TIGR02679 family)